MADPTSIGSVRSHGRTLALSCGLLHAMNTCVIPATSFLSALQMMCAGPKQFSSCMRSRRSSGSFSSSPIVAEKNITWGRRPARRVVWSISSWITLSVSFWEKMSSTSSATISRMYARSMSRTAFRICMAVARRMCAVGSTRPPPRSLLSANAHRTWLPVEVQSLSISSQSWSSSVRLCAMISTWVFATAGTTAHTATTAKHIVLPEPVSAVATRLYPRREQGSVAPWIGRTVKRPEASRAHSDCCAYPLIASTTVLIGTSWPFPPNVRSRISARLARSSQKLIGSVCW
mmetsp:Transcript_34185/g.80992  ORF Transcript_34185/g.80992 Transcript_34185/m.80992 type:complete len:289 (-) Transcript_34185:831-1697(-)